MYVKKNLIRFFNVSEIDEYAKIENHTVETGDFLSIDGWNGTVYAGQHESESE